MIDYVKLLISGVDIQKLVNKLDSTIKISEQTGEVLRQEISIHHCTIRIYRNNVVDFIGSIHKFYNSIKEVYPDSNYSRGNYNGYNGNVFTYSNILEVRDYLCDLLDCTPEQMKFQNMEVGVNLSTPFKPTKFIRGLLFHNGKEFEFKHKRNYAQAQHQRYLIKIYSKSNQYDMDYHVLRLELKLKKSTEIIKTGISTFDDVSPETLRRAEKLLIERISEVMYFDNTIRKEGLSAKVKALLVKYSNQSYWLDELKPQHRGRPKKMLNNILVNHSDNLKAMIIKQIQDTCVIINRLPNLDRC